MAYPIGNMNDTNVASALSVTVPGDVPAWARITATFTDSAPSGGRVIFGARGRDNLATYLRSLGQAATDTTLLQTGAAPLLADGGAGNVDTGQHFWASVFVHPVLGEIGNPPGGGNRALTLGSARQVNLSGVGTGAVGTGYTARRIYRTKAGVGSTGPYFLAGTINDNTTSTFTDNVADSALGAQFVPSYVSGPVYYVTFATVTGWAKRAHTAATSMQTNAKGTWRVFMRANKTVATDEIWLRLQWNAGFASNPSTRNEVFKLDAEYNTTKGVLVDLGTVTLPTADPNMNVYGEVWATRKSGTGGVVLNSLFMVPTDVYAEFQVQRTQVDEWTGDQFANSVGSPTTGTGVAQSTTAGDKVRYHTGNPAAGTYGETLATGVHHVVEFDIEHSDDSGTTTVAVYDNTTSTVLASRTKTTAGRETLRLKVASTSATDVHYFEVANTTAGTNTLTVNGVSHAIVYPLAQNEYLLHDPVTPDPVPTQHYDTSGRPLRAARHSGDRVKLPPGVVDAVVLLLDSDTFPAGFSMTPSRQASLDITVQPAYVS